MFESFSLIWGMRHVLFGNLRALFYCLWHAMVYFIKYPFYCIIAKDGDTIEDYPNLVKHRDMILKHTLEAQLNEQFDAIITTFEGMGKK